MTDKMIIFCAPSGSGKTTIAHAILDIFPNLSFSISATSRLCRDNEKDGVDYYFLKPDEFKKKIINGDFLEWEEFYNGTFYGTLKEEIFKIQNSGKIPVFDIDVKGALNLKKQYGKSALVIFIKVPIEIIKDRLLTRKTETIETLNLRLERIKEEMGYEKIADEVVENIELDKAIDECKKIVEDFIK